MRKQVVLAALAAAVSLCLLACGSPHGQSAFARVSTTPVGRLGGPPPGTPATGDVLYATTGKWSGSPTGFAYAWEDCDSGGANCTAAAGSPTNTARYQIVSGDQGSTIRVAVTASYSGHPDSTILSPPTGVVSAVSFPLSVSSSGRYLQTASGTPFLLTGDSPQSGIGDLTQTAFNAYLDDRSAHGFNAVWEWLLCDGYGSFCNANGSASGDGSGAIFPFSGMTSPSNADVCGSTTGPCTTPNTSYFSRVHNEAAHAEAKGMVMVLTPLPTQNCNTGTWYDALINNGTGSATATNTKDYQYGAWLGNYFKDLPNIMWFSGNDFQCIETAAANNDELDVAAGIASTDPASNALQSLEPDYCASLGYSCEGSSSLADTNGVSTGWSSTVQLNGSYTYAPTYAEDATAYGQSSAKPMFLEEANYEGETDGGTDGCTTVRNCRLQEWWTMTSGATGQFYGCHCTTQLTNSTSLSTIDTTGVTQLGYVSSLLSGLSWQNLSPDTGHAIVTSGFGTCPTTGSITGVTCVTTAADSFTTGAAHLAISYLPGPSSLQTVTVNLAKFAGSVTARWYDPTSGSFSSISGSPFTNSGTHNFTPTAANNAGDDDWVLVLQA